MSSSSVAFLSPSFSSSYHLPTTTSLTYSPFLSHPPCPRVLRQAMLSLSVRMLQQHDSGDAPPKTATNMTSTSDMIETMGACIEDIESKEQLELYINDPGWMNAENKPGLVILDVWAPWCRPCLKSAREFSRACKVHQDVKFLKLNAGDHKELSQSLGVRSYPTFILYKGGKRIDDFKAVDRDTMDMYITDNS